MIGCITETTTCVVAKPLVPIIVKQNENDPFSQLYKSNYNFLLAHVMYNVHARIYYNVLNPSKKSPFKKYLLSAPLDPIFPHGAGIKTD